MDLIIYIIYSFHLKKSKKTSINPETMARSNIAVMMGCLAAFIFLNISYRIKGWNELITNDSFYSSINLLFVIGIPGIVVSYLVHKKISISRIMKINERYSKIMSLETAANLYFVYALFYSLVTIFLIVCLFFS